MNTLDGVKYVTCLETLQCEVSYPLRYISATCYIKMCITFSNLIGRNETRQITFLPKYSSVILSFSTSQWHSYFGQFKVFSDSHFRAIDYLNCWLWNRFAFLTAKYWMKSLEKTDRQSGRGAQNWRQETLPVSDNWNYWFHLKTLSEIVNNVQWNHWWQSRSVVVLGVIHDQ